MEKMLKVQGYDGLVRDPSSQAIVNTNKIEYRNYIKQREAALLKLQEQNRQTEEINNLKKDVSEIKEMLLQLLKDR